VSSSDSIATAPWIAFIAILPASACAGEVARFADKNMRHFSPVVLLSTARIAVVGGVVFVLNAARFVPARARPVASHAELSMIMEERVFVAGAGPVGLVAAAALVRRGIPVTVFEALPALSRESRASTFHPSTLDMLDDIGVADALIATGLIAPRLQYRTRRDGIIAAFDFAAIADLTRHPYRLQSEQHNLTRIIDAKLRSENNYRIEFDKRVCGARQDADGVTVTLMGADGATEERRARWLIGADGARSEVRKALDVEFEGFTWPERFLVIGTTFDFYETVPGLDAVSYVADPTQWHFYLQIPSMWRMMFPIAPEVSDETATSRDFARRTLATVQPDATDDDIAHVTLYRVHQRVAKTFRVGRAFLAGDAAHINNPLGGMGMNGGIHDAVNLTERLARVWHGEADDAELDRYDQQRRLVTLEYVQKHTIQNKRNLETSDPAEQARFREELRTIAGDARLTREYLLRISMIASLKRAAELG
jgi:2-polyprenyl-6-methoxyphenol hydroxylase-like FAD-dependent oxidoreductase